MDNKKIGKLIADLRRKQGLTQQDLGDKVGVGFRAVSKWERGLTLPDISIINELSKILGISSDELLSGEIKRSNKEKKLIPTKIKVIITLIISIIIILSSIYIYYNNKTYAYSIASVNQEEFYVKGKVIFDRKSLSILINELNFKDSRFSAIRIKNYEYDIKSGDKFIFRYGYIYDINETDEIMSIEKLTDEFNINNIIQTKFKRKEIIKDNIIIVLKFITEDDIEITKEIEIKLELKSEE